MKNKKVLEKRDSDKKKKTYVRKKESNKPKNITPKKQNISKDKKENKKKWLLLLLFLFLFVFISLGITYSVNEEFKDSVDETIINTLKIDTPTAPKIGGSSKAWSKKEVIKIIKDAKSYSGISHYEYCMNKSTDFSKCEWIKTETKNMVASTTGEYYIVFRAVSKDGSNGLRSNIEKVLIDNNNPIIEKIIIKDKTDTSVKVEIKAVDKEAGIKGYYYAINEEDYKEGKSSYTYKNLEKDKIYTIYIKIVDKLGNTTVLSMNIKAGQVCDLNCDINGDGVCDVNCDLNNDGKCDLNCDSNYDGICDLNCDINGDGICDTNCDTNKDGICDINCGLDINGDGDCDLNCDFDKDGKCDLNCDLNGDKVCDLNCDTNKDLVCDIKCDTDGDGICDIKCDEEETILPEEDFEVPQINLNKVPAEFAHGNSYELPSYYKFGPSGGIVECVANGKKVTNTSELGLGTQNIECIAKGNNGINVRVSKQVKVVVAGGEDEVFDGWIRLNLYYPENSINRQWRLGKEGEIRDGYDNTGWQDYTGPILVRINETDDVYIRYDLLGETYIIAPNGKVVVDIEPDKYSLSGKEETTVKITYDKDATVKEYKVGSGAWQEYKGEFKVSKNTLVEARAIKEVEVYDSEGNKVSTKKVSGSDSIFIGEVIPSTGSGSGGNGGSGSGNGSGTIGGGTGGYRPSGGVTRPSHDARPSEYLRGPIISLNTEQPAKSVSVSITTLEEAREIYYKIGNGQYQKYEGSFEVGKNVVIRSYYVRESDGKVSSTSYKYINNIYKETKSGGVLPYIRIDASPDYLSNDVDLVEVSISGSNYNTLEYSYDGKIYTPYTNKLLISESSTVYARGTNQVGTTVEKLTIVTNTPSIVKDNLDITIVANPESNKLINKTVITINYDNRAENKYYKFAGEENYRVYTGPFVLMENTTIYAYATGNNLTGSSEKGIDFLTTGIMAPKITVTPTSITNIVNVEIEFDKNAKRKYYQIDGGEKLYYTGSFEVYENSEIYAYNNNIFGHENDSTYEITNIGDPRNFLVIDKGKYYIIKVNYPENSRVREYKWKKDGTWKEYDPIGILLIKEEYKDEFDLTGYDGIKVKDENDKDVIFTDHYYILDVPASKLNENLFMRWDTTKPSAPTIVLNTEEATKEVEVGIVYSANLVEKYYKIQTPDGKDTGWLEYTGPIKVADNNSIIYAKGVTVSDVESEIANIVITNVDKESPKIEIKVDSTTPKQQVDVVVAVDDFSLDQVRWLKGEKTVSDFKDKGTEVKNNGAFTVSENGKYTIYAVDKAGNEIIKVIEITNVDKNAPNIIIDVETRELSDEIEVSIDYGDSTVKEYKIGESETYQTYTDKLKITSYDVLNLADQDGSLTIYAKGVDEAGNESIVKEITYLLDLDIIAEPIIYGSDGYPHLTYDGMQLGQENYIVYDKTRDDLSNYYRINGGDWEEYTGPFIMSSGKIEAKSVKDKTGLTVTANKEVVIPGDGVKAATYDGSLDTVSTQAANTSNYFTVDTNLIGEELRLYLSTIPADNGHIKLYNYDGLELGTKALTSGTTVFELVENIYKVEIYAGSSDLGIREIGIRNEIKLLSKSTPTIKIDKTEWTADKIATITYPLANYTNEYSIDGGTTWEEYTGPIKLVSPTTVMARIVNGSKIITSSTFIVEKIDAEEPIIELNMSNKIQIGYEIELPTYYKIGKSGGSKECKVGDKVITNTSELELGVHEIVCTIENNIGVKKKVSKVVNIVEAPDLTGDSILEILARDDIITGKYSLEANGEIYPANIYVFDDNQEWNENQMFGDYRDIGTEITEAKNMVIVKVNGDLTINDGVTVGPYYNEYGGPKGFTLYVTGTLTNNGTIDNSHGAKATGQDVYLWKNTDGTYEYIPSEGAVAANAYSIESGWDENNKNGRAGTDGINRQTGSGGSGRSQSYANTTTISAGGNGTSYSGGAGSGAGRNCTTGAGSSSGGAGGSGCGGFQSGAGNPSGGTGGLLTIYANGWYNNGIISADGSTPTSSGTGGGGSGGGSINIFTNQSTGINQLGIITDTRYAEIKGQTSNAGGLGAATQFYSGGSGGNGTMHIGEIRNGQYYDLKEVIDQDKEAYKRSVTLEGDSILSLLSNDRIKTGYWFFKVNGEEYPAHVYVFDEDQEWLENKSFGDEMDVATANDNAQNMVIVKVNGDLTVGEGVTVGPYYNEYGGPKGFTLYVTGTLTNNGTIDNSHGAKAEGQNVYLWKNADGTYEYVPADGGIYDNGYSVKTGWDSKSYTGVAGVSGIERQTGSGGSGAAITYSSRATVSAGGAGTSYSGGPGSGAANADMGSCTSGAGEANGGAGGSGCRGFASGAGNPSGGTGGLLTIYANGWVNNGTITANGTSPNVSTHGAGSSGGGSINIFTNQPIGINQLGVITDTRYEEIKGQVTSTGGASVGTSRLGGAGGNGTYNIGEIRNGQYYDLKEIIEQDKELYKNSVTLTGDSIISALANDNIKTGYWLLNVNGQEYPAHIYVFEEDQTWTESKTFGDAKDVATETDYAQNMVIVKVNGNLTIAENVTVGPYYDESYGGPKGFTLYVTGKLTNNGTIDNSHGAKAEGQDVYLWKNVDGTYEYVPAVGATYNNSYSKSPGWNSKSYYGIDGMAGSGRETGSGGSGGARAYAARATVSAGGAGTSYSGGPGSGAANGNQGSCASGAGASDGGAGGLGCRGYPAGAGNPSGGTGGLLIIYTNDYENNGLVSANGASAATSSYSGGSSGGGSINIFYNIMTNQGNSSQIGGIRVGRGGAGGAGTITYTQINNVSIGVNNYYSNFDGTRLNDQYFMVNISYFSTIGNNVYSLDNGLTWNNYTGPIKVKENATITAKATSTLGTEVQETYTATLLNDNISSDLFDNDKDTTSTITSGSSASFSIAENLVNQTLRFYVNGTPATDAKITMYDINNNEVESVSITDSATILNIPENTYLITVSAGSSDLELTEISLREGTVILATTPEITLDNTGWSYQKQITISYPEGYTNEYSVDGGNSWQLYQQPITVTANTTVIARTLDETGKVVSSSSYTITKIDATEPTITLDVPDEITVGDEYPLPSTYTVDETKSGGSAVCLVENEETPTTKSLGLGSHEIVCTVTTGAGKTKTITKTITVVDVDIDITLEVPERILLGSSYPLPSSVTGGTGLCKIGDVTYTNTSTLTAGTYDIICTVTSPHGSVKEINKTVEVYEDTTVTP